MVAHPTARSALSLHQTAKPSGFKLLPRAARLAWYKAKNGFGVLAPRDWHCFGTYGSSGATLYVSPEPINSKLVFSSEWKGFAGPAIQISHSNGGSSGRFEVAQTIARLFPAHIDFVRQVIAEGIEPASHFPSGPYLKDKLTYVTRTLVSFETPAHSKGLGTDSRLQPNDQAIQGLVFLSMEPNDDPYDISLAIRMPHSLVSLSRRILSETSTCFPRTVALCTPHSIPSVSFAEKTTFRESNGACLGRCMPHWLMKLAGSLPVLRLVVTHQFCAGRESNHFSETIE